jgi:hypothetical protein
VWGPCQDQQLPQTENCATVGDEDCDGVPCSEHLWSKIAGDNLNQGTVDVAVLQSSGRVAVVGNFRGTIDLGGGALTSAGGLDFFVAVYEANGTHVWSRRFGGLADDRGAALAFDSAGHLWVTGSFAGEINLGGATLTAVGTTVDAFLLQLDTANAGAHLFSSQLTHPTYVVAPTGEKHLYGMAIDASDNVYVVGDASGTYGCNNPPMCVQPADASANALVRKYDSAGVYTWGVTFSGADAQAANAIAIDSQGNPIIGGTFFTAITIGASSFTAPALDRYPGEAQPHHRRWRVGSQLRQQLHE